MVSEETAPRLTSFHDFFRPFDGPNLPRTLRLLLNIGIVPSTNVSLKCAYALEERLALVHCEKKRHPSKRSIHLPSWDKPNNSAGNGPLKSILLLRKSDP
jgi:hypothetical protein